MCTHCEGVEINGHGSVAFGRYFSRLEVGGDEIFVFPFFETRDIKSIFNKKRLKHIEIQTSLEYCRNLRIGGCSCSGERVFFVLNKYRNCTPERKI